MLPSNPSWSWTTNLPIEQSEIAPPSARVIVDVYRPMNAFKISILDSLKEFFNEPPPYHQVKSMTHEMIRQAFCHMNLPMAMFDAQLKAGVEFKYLVGGEFIQNVDFLPQRVNDAWYEFAMSVYCELIAIGIVASDRYRLEFETLDNNAILVALYERKRI